jgi:hypothetical protein
MNYNLFALRGDDTMSDAEVCNTFDLPISLANTPKLNDAIIEKMRKENIQGYLKKGINESEAYKLADQKADAVRKEIKQYLA